MLKKLLSGVLCLSMLFVSIALPTFALDRESFAQKIIYEDAVYDDLSDGNVSIEDSPKSVSVVLHMKESFFCHHDDFENYNEGLEHREELYGHYTAQNKRIIKLLNLKDYDDITYSWYGPFIEYEYSSYSDFVKRDYGKLSRTNLPEIDSVYIRNNYKAESFATVDDYEAKWYSFSQAFSDIGIPSEKPYDGTGIKIGILETCLPSNDVHLSGITYEEYGTTRDEHAFYVYSILGGTTGIANGAQLYMAALEDNSYLECCNWLLSKGVSVINHSGGIGITGEYTSVSAYADYLVKNARVTYVAAVGNSRNKDTYAMPYIAAPATGLNVIAIAATTAEFKIQHNSSNFLTSTWEEMLLKPTLAAPGGELYGMAYMTRTRGTSFATPMVTGIIALLMEEFPVLKTNPEMVMALLTNTCGWVTGQNQRVDDDAGFGLVNYTRARECFNNTYSFQVGNVSSGTLVSTRNITIPANSKVHVAANIFYNSSCIDPNGSWTTPTYTKIKVKLLNNTTNVTVSGITNANHSYITYENNTSSDVSCSILIYTNSSKGHSSTENAAASYWIETSDGHVHDYSHHYNTYSTTRHYAYCSCGNYITETHAFQSQGSLMVCTDCGHSVAINR